MIDLIKPFPGESEESFVKRKAYYFRILRRRFNYGEQVMTLQSPNGIPITQSDQEEIDVFWNQFLQPEQRDQLVDYSFYNLYKNLNKNKDHRLSYYIPDTFILLLMNISQILNTPIRVMLKIFITCISVM